MAGTATPRGPTVPRRAERRGGRSGRRRRLRPAPGRKYQADPAIGTTVTYWTRRPRTAILYSRRDRSHPAPSATRGPDGSPDPPVLVDSSPAPSSSSASWRCCAPVAADASFADRFLFGVVLVAGLAAFIHGAGGRGISMPAGTVEAESFARILSGLSRSVSPDAIVDAIAEELGEATERGPRRGRAPERGRPRARRPSRQPPAGRARPFHAAAARRPRRPDPRRERPRPPRPPTASPGGSRTCTG